MILPGRIGTTTVRVSEEQVPKLLCEREGLAPQLRRSSLCLMKEGLTLVALTLFSATAPAEIHYLNPWEGLRDYDKRPAFINRDPETIRQLSVAVSGAKLSTNPCKVGEVRVWKDWTVPLTSNVCDPAQFRAMLNLVVTLAPDLRNNTTLELVALSDSSPPALIVGHYDINQDPQVQGDGYPFLSLWRLRFTNGGYAAPHAGGFLNGTIHDVRPFGTNTQRKMVFVEHVNCIECEPTTYLTAVDFDAEAADAKAFEFTYSESHDGFGPTIEYVLPGMGHTIDAKVETRTLPPSIEGPHLLQSFTMEEGETRPNEWWVFTCRNFRCDYRLYTGEPPPEFRKLWDKAKRL